MNLLKNIKSFKLFIVIFCGTVVGVPEEITNPPTYDYYQDKGDSFNHIGAKTFKGDFIQTSSGKVLSQRTEGILYWEDIPYALPPLGNLRWKAPVAFVAKDFHINPKENNFCHQEVGGQIQEINQAGTEDCLYLILEHLIEIEIICQLCFGYMEEVILQDIKIFIISQNW